MQIQQTNKTQGILFFWKPCRMFHMCTSQISQYCM